VTAVLPEAGRPSDDALAQMIATGDDACIAAAIAEFDRRDRAAKHRAACVAAQRARYAGWEDAARANFTAAEQYCRGDHNMIGAAGRGRAGVTPWSLWYGSEDKARQYASEELITFWDYHQARPPSPREYVTAARAGLADRKDVGGVDGDECVHSAHDNGPGSVPDSDRGGVNTTPGGVNGSAGREASLLDRVQAARERHERDSASRPAVFATLQAQAEQAVNGHQGMPRAEVAIPAAGRVAYRATPPAVVVSERSCDPADGVEALNLMSRFFAHYDHFPGPASADLLAAWSLQTHAVNDAGEPIWRALPRLIVAGPYGCGKSGTLDNIAMATGTTVLIKVSYAGIRNRIGKSHLPAILDDAQLTFGAGRKSEDVRLVINAHTRGREAEDGAGAVSTYGQVAMAGLPKLLTGKVSHEISDTLSRCFVLWKERKPKDMHIPEVSDAGEALMRDKAVPGMREWCASFRDLLKARSAEFGDGAPTGLPDLGDGGRGNDQLARPLLTVCDVATSLVPEEVRDTTPEEVWNWSERIRRALIHVSGAAAPVAEKSQIGGVSAAFEELWAGDSTVNAEGDDLED